MMQKYVVVVYDFYETESLNSSVNKKSRWERVPFSEENVRYNNDLTYEENVHNFVETCIEGQAVYIGEKWILLHNIHGFYFDRESQKNSAEVTKEPQVKSNPQPQQPQQQQQRQQQSKMEHRKHGNYKKIKHRHDKPRMPAATTLPFQVESNPVTPPPPEPPTSISNDYNAEP